ncbi:alpha/beta hydrolase [Streptomyces sp. NPDC090052]|uniref:alpha/beta hydrolase n=1 Tax=Streptomyces sp. NPDC090052 TaxID=3365931 RepID=UPI0037FB5AD1
MSDPGGRGDTFCGINPEALQGTINSLKRDAGRLRGSATGFKTRFDQLGIDTLPLTKLLHVASWADDQLPMLRRRHHLAVLIDKGADPVLHYPNCPDMIMVDDADVSADPPKVSDVPDGSDPKLNADWWGALTPGMRAELTFLYPDRIGALDGLPSTVRDEANRTALSKEKGQLNAKLNKLRKDLAATKAIPPSNVDDVGGAIGGDPAYELQNKIDAVQSKLSGIAAVEQGLAKGDHGGFPHAYLLGFDTHKLGHAIVSFGDPDTADDTVTYVPGLGSKLAGAEGDISRASALWQSSNQQAPNKHVASIYWLGYDAPQLAANSHGADVASESDANAGAPLLRRFTQGLTAARAVSSPVHTVVLGHSYGSLVTGRAAVHGKGKLADDLIFVGSPGVGVDRASDLHVDPSHVWAGANSHDPVPDLPGPDPFEDLGGNASSFGTNPASTAFGGHVFQADQDPSNSFSSVDLDAHSSYWDSHSESLDNLAKITVGDYGDVTEAPQIPSDVPTSPTLVGPGVL